MSDIVERLRNSCAHTCKKCDRECAYAVGDEAADEIVSLRIMDRMLVRRLQERDHEIADLAKYVAEVRRAAFAAGQRASIAEIDRLRALITEWADIFDVYPGVHGSGWHDRWDAANDALRKAVGR